jgi:DNA-directed RNA polymerase specialized sigma24 family protein
VWQEPYPEDDRRLVERCQKGDPLAFEELVRKYQQTVFNLAYHYVGYRNEVEDVAQTIFTKVYFSLPKFDLQRPFFPWLYRIAVNQCYDELRRIRRQRTHTFTELNLDETGSIENLLRQNEMAIVLRDLEAVPYSKIAEILKCSEQAARLKVFRARARLKTLVEKTLRKQSVVSD